MVIAPVENVGGWVGIGTGLVALGALLYDRLRGSGKVDADLLNQVNTLGLRIDALDREFGTIEVQLALLDKKLSEVLYELRGVDGTNGVKGTNRSHGLEITAIKKRLAAYDVITALFKAERDAYQGEDRRHITRRLLDVKLMDLANQGEIDP